MGNLKGMLAIGALVLVLVLGVAAYSVFRTPAAASGPIQALPLADNPTQAPEPTSAPVATADSPTAATAPASTASAAAAPEAQASDEVILQIVQAESEARFIIDEVLNNEPKTVVGATDQVAGEIGINRGNLAASRVGVIQINARDLTTDNDFRNRAIKNQILQTDQYEFVTFTPAEIVGLPQNGKVGESYTFQIAGDLTIRDVTRRVTFDVTAQAISESRVEGTATTTIAYADYNITIPRVRQVASIADQVRLELDFVAAAA